VSFFSRQFYFSFYRATLCISADYAVAWCLSVHPSVTLVHCIQMAKNIVKLLSRPGSPITLVFDRLRRYLTSRGTPSAGRKIHGVGKFCDFRLKSPSISETMQDRPMVTLER